MFLKDKLGCFFSFFFAGFNCLDFYTRWIQHVVDPFLHFCCCYVALFAAMQLQDVDLIFKFARFKLWLFFCIFIGFAVTLFGAEYDYVLDRPRLYTSVYPHWLTWPQYNIELDRWSRAVKEAAERIRYDSQLELARQLGVDSEPFLFNESQRSVYGKHYEGIPMGQVEPDGHEILWRESGGSQEMKFTGNYVFLRPRYQRRSSDLSFVELKEMPAADYRTLMI